MIPFNNRKSGLSRILVLLMAATAMLLLAIPASASPAGITVSVLGDSSHPLGENMVISGDNYESNTTYLFILGPNLPQAGGKLTAPHKGVVSGDPDSFIAAPVNAQGRWEYQLLTSPLGISTGIYTIYAVSDSRSQKDLIPGQFNSTTVILKEPLLTAAIDPSPVRRGDRFTVSGQFKEYPDTLGVWIIGNNFLYNATIPTGPGSGYLAKIDTKTSENLPLGQCYLIVQHPRGADLFNIVVDGDWISLVTEPGNNQKLFRYKGAGSLQGRDAANAMLAVFDDPSVDDGYTVVPLVVNKSHITAFVLAEEPVTMPPASGAGPAMTDETQALTTIPTTLPMTTSLPVPSMPDSTQPVPTKTKAAMIPYAAAVAAVLVCGIFVMGRK